MTASECSLFAILFMSIFFQLGIFYKIMADFKKQMLAEIVKFKLLIFEHSHKLNGTVCIDRQKFPD